MRIDEKSKALLRKSPNIFLGMKTWRFQMHALTKPIELSIQAQVIKMGIWTDPRTFRAMEVDNDESSTSTTQATQQTSASVSQQTSLISSSRVRMLIAITIAIILYAAFSIILSPLMTTQIHSTMVAIAAVLVSVTNWQRMESLVRLRIQHQVQVGIKAMEELCEECSNVALMVRETVTLANEIQLLYHGYRL
jgi:hypothetical protein